jgi:hypothetical protein
MNVYVFFPQLNSFLSFATLTFETNIRNITRVPKGIVLNQEGFREKSASLLEEPLAHFGSADDIEQVKRNPLLRARFCLQYVLGTVDHQVESEIVLSARLSLCYVELVFQNYRNAQALVQHIIEEMPVIIANDKHQSKGIQRLHKRQLATAYMYSAEIGCALGEVNDAMTAIVRDGTEDTLARFASQLSGVTVATVAMSKSAKYRLSKAQTMVRSAAVVVKAVFKNTGIANEMTPSVRELEDVYSNNRDLVSYKRAMIYASLREKSSSSAVAMLLS